MENKHLLSVNLTESKKNDYFDDTPFTTARLSTATREAKESGSKDLTKVIMKSMKLPQLLAGYILVGLGLIVLSGFIKALPETGFMTALQNGKWLLIAGAILAAIGAGLIIYCKQAHKKQEESEDTPSEMDESLNTLEGISRHISMELGLPEDDQTISVEMLPYRYKLTSDGGTKESLKNGCYENTEISLWIEDNALCMTDYDCVMRIPTSAIEGYYTADVKFRISFWWKDEDFDKGEYAEYKIKQDSEGNYKLRTFYRVVIREGADAYELRIPCYDFPAFQRLVDVPCLDEQEQV